MDRRWPDGGTKPSGPGLIAMPSLQIPSHSRRITGFAVAGLAVLAAGAFSFGLERQVRHVEAGPALFPAARTADAPAYVDNIPNATPARPLEVAVDTRARHRMSAAEILDVPDQVAPPQAASAADAAPAVDASATAPAPKVAAEPNPAEPPT